MQNERQHPKNAHSGFRLWIRDRYDDLLLQSETARAIDRHVFQTWRTIVWCWETYWQWYDFAKDWLSNYGAITVIVMMFSWMLYTLANASTSSSADTIILPQTFMRPDYMLRPRKTDVSNWGGEWKAIGDDEVVRDPPQQVIKTVTVKLTRVIGEPQTATATSYWDPPTGPEHAQDLGDDWVGWCRVCKQVHCCELPY